jgi:hypothetical protein
MVLDLSRLRRAHGGTNLGRRQVGRDDMGNEAPGLAIQILLDPAAVGEEQGPELGWCGVGVSVDVDGLVGEDPGGPAATSGRGGGRGSVGGELGVLQLATT